MDSGDVSTNANVSITLTIRNTLDQNDLDLNITDANATDAQAELSIHYNGYVKS